MIQTWEGEDVKGGVWASKPDGGGRLNSTVCIYTFNDNDNKGKQYGLCHVSSHGGIIPIGDKKQMAQYLTGNRYKPINKHDYLP